MQPRRSRRHEERTKKTPAPSPKPKIQALAARGETPAAFGRRCIPAGCVAPRSNTPGILARRALPSGRIAALGATLDFHHGLLEEGVMNRSGSWYMGVGGDMAKGRPLEV